MNLWLRLLLPFSIGYFLSYGLRNINAVIAPELARELGGNAGDLGLLTSAFLIAFGLAQLPLGILLDRFGPRRVEAGLLLIAAVGCALFSVGHDLAQLAAARAMIGLGVSACLMAAFKAFNQWFPAEQHASVNAIIMSMGGLGALTASVPVAWILPIVGWRGIFLILAGLLLCEAFVIFATPEKVQQQTGESFEQALRGVASVLGSAAFWRYAPQSALIAGGFVAMQGLWEVPWLMTFNGAPREVAAFHLVLVNGGMLLGYLVIAGFGRRLSVIGIGAGNMLTAGVVAFLLVTLLTVLDTGPTQLLWTAMGVAFAFANVVFAVLAAYFPPHLAGRVHTTLNLVVFACAFTIQWGFGIVLDAFIASGFPARDAYRWTYAALLSIQVLAHGWYYVAGKQARPAARASDAAEQTAEVKRSAEDGHA